MAKVINIIACKSNVGKTTLIEGLIKELKLRGHSVATIKHDAHDFEIDKEGKDTWRHRKAGAEAVLISSKSKMAMIKELEEEISLEDLIDMVSDYDFVIVEGYKKSDYKKIEVFRREVSEKIITPKEKLIAIASDVELNLDGVLEVNINDYKSLADIVEKVKL